MKIKTFEFEIFGSNGRQFTASKIDEKVNEWLGENKAISIKDIKINMMYLDTKLGRTTKMIYTIIYYEPQPFSFQTPKKSDD